MNERPSAEGRGFQTCPLLWAGPRTSLATTSHLQRWPCKVAAATAQRPHPHVPAPPLSQPPLCISAPTLLPHLQRSPCKVAAAAAQCLHAYVSAPPSSHGSAPALYPQLHQLLMHTNTAPAAIAVQSGGCSSRAPTQMPGPPRWPSGPRDSSPHFSPHFSPHQQGQRGSSGRQLLATPPPLARLPGAGSAAAAQRGGS